MNALAARVIKPKVTHRRCPGCNYLLTQLAASKLLANFHCPRCKNRKVSEFKPLKILGT